MKKAMAFALALLIMLAPSLALAAPTRDMGDMEIPVSEQMQHMLNLLFSAAMIEDVGTLDADAGIDVNYQQTLFSLFNYVEGGEGDVNLSSQDVRNLYELFFAAGEADASIRGGMQADLNLFDEMPLAGAYVHESKMGEGDTLVLTCDLYTLWGYFSTPAQWVPEGDLTWWASAGVTLKTDESAAYGYTLKAFEIGKPYMDGLTADWQLVENAAMEYSVRLPSVLGLADDRADFTVYQTADGEATVHITCTEKMGYDEAVAAFRDAHAGVPVTEERDFFSFTAVQEGYYALCIAEENLPYVYTLEMYFPSERQQEYTLYADLIRNSLAVWGLNNG